MTDEKTVTTTTESMVEAIYEQRLVQFASALLDDTTAGAADRRLAAKALATCTSIGDRMTLERKSIHELLRAADVHVASVENSAPRQLHQIEIRFSDHHEARRAAAVLSASGFVRWEPWTGGAEESFWRTADAATLAHTDDCTVVCRLRWRNPAADTWKRWFRPAPADWQRVELPRRAWPTYSAVRPLRLMGERVGLLRRTQVDLQPYLSTPEQLIDPLLEFADVGSGDVLLDFGCGDGRVVVAAAERTGCRAVGVERRPALVRQARELAAARECAESVRVECRNTFPSDLSGVTVLFMFLPPSSARDILPIALRRLPEGARIIVHEQRRLPDDMLPPPDRSAPLLADQAITVAHRWDVRRRH